MNIDISHHIKGIRPALKVMQDLGFSAEKCLEGSGITLNALETLESGISLEQEFSLYRHLLTLTQDPMIGLKLGTAFRLESYGVFGYAILSASTLREALMMASQYGALSFSLFTISLEEKNGIAAFQMSRRGDIPEDLLQVYEDRDCSAVVAGTVSALGQVIDLIEIRLMHAVHDDQRKTYEDMFKCPLSFGQERMELLFDASILDLKMPLRDAATAEYCRQQCEALLGEMVQSINVVDQVTRALRARLPDTCSTALMAQHLGMSERSLRRKLADQEVSFKTLLTNERKQQAVTLIEAGLDFDQIAVRLGYSEAANFSHAFKRWFGVAPRNFRTDKYQ